MTKTAKCVFGYEKTEEYTHTYSNNTFKQPITAEGHQRKCMNYEEYGEMEEHNYGENCSYIKNYC